MRKFVLLLAAFTVLSFFSYGCATKDYVKQQVDPLVDRISKLEAATQGLKNCCDEANAAAARAEAAAKRARAAAEKSTKAFELQQKK
jgi:outer membrane murein-binding lipoprotein Lpp